ncbi:MAG: methyltransferase domain-containing protein [Candidatus Cloacimonetes bacterium]|nr:methyltransferase domain-containing protein [Candidatus Cloacimonadota bacterium]
MKCNADSLSLDQISFPGVAMLQDSSSLGATSSTAALYAYVSRMFCCPQLRILEAGSGSGILCIMLALANPEWDISGIEIQPQLCALANENALRLNLKVHFTEADIRDYAEAKPYDLIVSNPPWQKLNSGLQSPNPQRAICRSEVLCTMQDVFGLLRRNLSDSGTAILLYPKSRSDEVYTFAEAIFDSVVTHETEDKNCLLYHLSSPIKPILCEQ